MLDAEQQTLLSQRICELPLKIEGTHLEDLIAQLYQELERAGISIKPRTYLSDGWGCPNRVPVIGIPFYVVDPRLCNLKGQLTGIEAEGDAEIMMILRHEAGHAFNYAYRIYHEPEWQKLFGRFSLPYKDQYKVLPFSARFVRHSPGWYVQKHPDDDFAETFAVWLTPDSDWQKRYADTPALVKLEYVDKAGKRYGEQPPIVTSGKLDMPLGEMTMTLESWYMTHEKGSYGNIVLHKILNEDLMRLLPAIEGQPAIDILRINRQQLIRDVHCWTGIDRYILITLVDELLERIQLLELKIEPGQTTSTILSTSVFITTLVTNYIHKGQFIDA
ncbi:MAG: hypothetical protein V1932_05250 [Chloroflexota bacterium]